MRSAFCSAAVYSVLHFAAQQLCAFCNLQRSSVLQFAAPLRHIARVRVSVIRAASTAFCILQRCALAAVVHLSRWNGGMRRPASLGTNNAVSSIALKMKSFTSSSVFHLSRVSRCEVHAVFEVYGKWMKETKADDTTRLNLGVHDRSLLSFHIFFKGSSPCLFFQQAVAIQCNVNWEVSGRPGSHWLWLHGTWYRVVYSFRLGPHCSCTLSHRSKFDRRPSLRLSRHVGGLPCILPVFLALNRSFIAWEMTSWFPLAMTPRHTISRLLFGLSLVELVDAIYGSTTELPSCGACRCAVHSCL